MLAVLRFAALATLCPSAATVLLFVMADVETHLAPSAPPGSAVGPKTGTRISGRG